MESLSVAASVYSIVGLILNVINNHRTLRDLFGDSDMVSALINEMTDLRVISDQINTRIHQHQSSLSSEQITYQAQLEQLLDATKVTLSELDNALHHISFEPLNYVGGQEKLKLFLFCHKIKIERLHQELRTSRQDMVVLFGMLNLSSHQQSPRTSTETLPSPTTVMSTYLEFVQHNKLNERSRKGWSGHGSHVEYDAVADVPVIYRDFLGTGSFATVEKVEIRRHTLCTPRPPPHSFPLGAPPNGGTVFVARKHIRPSYKLKLKTIMDEVQHLDQMRHRHVVQLVGTHVVGNRLSILMYPAGDSNLRVYLEEPDSFYSDTSESLAYQQNIARFCGCIASALGYLHHNAMKHMDLKAENVIVKERSPGDYNIFIADFGLARKFDPVDGSKTSHTIYTTPKYAAPEVVLNKPRGRSADIFSLGCLYSEMATVLVGASLEEFKDVRITDDPLVSYFYKGIPAVDRWLSSLFSPIPEFLERDEWHRMLECIRWMVREEANARPNIDQVYHTMAWRLSGLAVGTPLSDGAPCACTVEMEDSHIFWD
ncbi:MAG: hypothetical protein M1836_005686 [Candelina mexicana]|nr:MAG: hypothetical protein M1836_005686 [Candelina mexicana]